MTVLALFSLADDELLEHVTSVVVLGIVLIALAVDRMLKKTLAISS
jgi:hypothetical protein